MFRKLANLPSRRQPDQIMEIGRVPHGLNTYEPPDRLSLTEASKLLNWMIEKGGKKVPRLPIALYSNSATTNAIKQIKGVNIGGTDYELVIDSGYRLYYLDGSLDPTLIGTLEGDATVLNYNGVVMIFDGSYIKYIEGVSTVEMAYDAADYQFDFTSNLQNTTLGCDASILYIGQEFTTQTWTAGYDMPPTSATFYLAKVGTPSGWYKFGVWRKSDDIIIGLSDQYALQDLSTTAAEFTINLDSFPNKLDPATNYYVGLYSPSCDGSNYITIACTSTSSGGEAFTSTDATTWTTVTTKDAVCKIAPSRPPKGKYGKIWNNRPFVWGDPDNLGVMHYGNLTYLDWSSTNGGGSLGIVDDSGDAYEVGGAEPFWNDLYVFGTQGQPYMVKITGTEPNDYAQNVVFKEPWTVPNGTVNSVNELWFINADGVSPISGVNDYGDLRTRTASDPVYDTIKANWSSTTAFAGYYPPDGQLWLFMPTYNKILVCHTKLGIRGPDGYTKRYPWTEYEYYRHDLTSSTYKWTANGAEYVLEIAAGGDPSILVQPDFLTMDGVKLTEGTAGSLADHEWAYDDEPDAAAHKTIYIKDVSGDPDTSGVEIKTVMLPTCVEQSGTNFLLASNDKFIYKVDASATSYTDMGSIDIDPIWRSGYIEMNGGYSAFNKMQPLMSCETAPDATQLITNGEFTTNTDNWTGLTGATLTNPDSTVDPGTASGGTSDECLKLSNDGTRVCRAFQLLTLEIGKPYEVSCLAYAPSSNTELIAAQMTVIQIRDSVVIGTESVTFEDEWQELSFIITPTRTESYIRLICNDSDAGGKVYFDKVSCIRETAFSSLDVNFYTDRQYTTIDNTETIQLPETSTEAQNPLFQYINFTAWAVMVETTNVSMSSPIFDDGLRLWFRALST